MASTNHDLPESAPNIKPLAEARGSGFLPWALYTLSPRSKHAELSTLATRLEGDAVINPGDEDTIHLVQAASEPRCHQTTLKDALDHHISYCLEHFDQLDYFPFGFLVLPADEEGAGEKDVVWLVHAFFEEPYDVTAFRMKYRDVEQCCAPLRDDDVSAEEIRTMYEVK